MEPTSRDATTEPIHGVASRWEPDYAPYTPAHVAAIDAARRFASAALSRREPRWLTFLGPSGIGKTHLMRQTLKLCRRLIDVNGWPRELTVTRVVPARDLDVWTAAREFADDFDVIFIEDIGAGAGAEKGAGKVVKDRIAELLQLRSRKFTLIDANFPSVGAVEDYFDGRIASRLMRDLNETIIFPPETPDFSTLK